MSERVRVQLRGGPAGGRVVEVDDVSPGLRIRVRDPEKRESRHWLYDIPYGSEALADEPVVAHYAGEHDTTVRPALDHDAIDLP